MEVIEIKNGVVTLFEQSIVRQVGLGSFKDQLASSLGSRTPILPRATILYASRQARSVYVIEQEPTTRNIQYRTGEVVRAYTIPLPWVYFAVLFHNNALDNVYVYFAKRAVESERDTLCSSALPNTFDDCRVCLGDYRYTITRAVPRRIDDVTRQYWASTFNQDVQHVYKSRMPERIKNSTPDGEEYFEAWTRIPLDEVCGLDWQSCGTIEHELRAILGG